MPPDLRRSRRTQGEAMTERRLEATPTVLEAVARTEAILREQMGQPQRREHPEPLTEPNQRRGLVAWLDACRARFTGWSASTGDPGP